MNLVQRLGNWGDSHHPKWLDIVRICLGLFLFYKGIEFAYNMGDMLNLMANKLSFGSFVVVMLGHYVVFAHLIGGFLLVAGILTRLACLIQIPVLLGAIIFINSTGENIFKPFSELSISIFTLLFLVYFLVIGNGPWSVSRFVTEDKS